MGLSENVLEDLEDELWREADGGLGSFGNINLHLRSARVFMHGGKGISVVLDGYDDSLIFIQCFFASVYFPAMPRTQCHRDEHSPCLSSMFSTMNCWLSRERAGQTMKRRTDLFDFEQVLDPK